MNNDFSIEYTDARVAGRATFVATANFVGKRASDIPQEELYRLACYYMLSQLDATNIRDAYEQLVETLEWQNASVSLDGTLNQNHPVPAALMEKVPSAPFGRLDD